MGQNYLGLLRFLKKNTIFPKSKGGSNPSKSLLHRLENNERLQNNGVVKILRLKMPLFPSH